MKDRFFEIYKSNITREGSDRLLEWLDRSDFFTAPASTKYHSAFEGGLLAHSLAVYDRLIANLSISPVNTSIPAEKVAESVAIVALLHDICKVNFYKIEMRNVKDAEGKWNQEPYYTIDDQLPYGHGEKSQYIISSFMKLNREETMAIRWHMGEEQGYPGLSSKAFRKYPLALMLHVSDLQAAFIDEEGEQK